MSYRIRKIVNLREIPTDEKKALSDAYVELAAAAIAGSEPDPELLEGWNKLYSDGEFLDKLHLIKDIVDKDGQILSFITGSRLEWREDEYVFFHQIAMTRPDIQGKGVTAQLWDSLISDEEFFPRSSNINHSWVFARTANPIAYIGARSFGERMPEAQVYPQVTDNGDVGMVPEVVSQAAAEALRQIDPSLSIRRDDLVIEGSFSKYRELWPNYDFPVNNEHVGEFFEKRLNVERRDSIMIVIKLTPQR